MKPYNSQEKNKEKLLDIGLGNNILDMTPKAQETKAKINKWDYNKVKICAAKGQQQNEKATYRMGENICKPYI